MTYQEIKDRLSKCELTLEKLKNGNTKDTIGTKDKINKLSIIKESYINLLKEADKGVIYTDDEKKAKDLADDGANVKLSEVEGTKFSVDETKSIAKSVGKSVAQALKSLGDEVAHMKAKKIEENSFDIYVQYKNDAEDEFSFYIVEDSLHLTDFSFDKELTDVGVKPSGESIVNVDVLANELTKHFKAMNEKVDSKDTPELKKLSKALKGSSQAHLDQKKKLDKLINTEGEVSEAPEGMYYIKIPKDAASQNKAQVIFNDLHGINYELNDDPDGIVMYFKKEDFDAGVIDDLEGDGVHILDTNIPNVNEDAEEDAKNDADYEAGWHDDPRQDEDTDVGHQDDEPNMLGASAMETAEYAAKLVKKLQRYDQHDGEVDFPHWWQKKLVLAREYISAAYHYLDSEEKQPAINQLALENVDKVAGGIPYKREGNKFIISEPLDDATKERIIGRAKEHGHKAAPNQAGGVTIIAKDHINEVDEDRYVRAAFEDLEQVIRNLAHTANISEDEALEMAIRKLEAMLDGRDDLDEKKNIVFSDSAYDMVVHTMKRLAKKYKAGDKSVVKDLKKLTHIKKQLEKAKIAKAAKIGQDQELETDTELREAGPGFKHDCAAKVIHKEHGAGNTIPEKHTLVKEGNKYVVTHYDVLFENGNTILDIPVNELDIKTTNEHWHKGYKKKKK